MLKINIINLWFLLISFIGLSQNIDYEEFKGTHVKVDQITNLDNPYLYDYKIKSNKGLIYTVLLDNSAEKILSEQKIGFFKENSFISLNYKLSFESEEGIISIIQYIEVEDSIKSNTKSIILIKINKWTLLNSNKYKQIQFIIENLNLNLFWEFYNIENNPKYPKINKLKPLVQDSNGVLNITKLVELLKNNTRLMDL